MPFGEGAPANSLQGGHADFHFRSGRCYAVTHDATTVGGEANSVGYCAKLRAVRGGQEVGLGQAPELSRAREQVWLFVHGKGEPSISCSLIHSRQRPKEEMVSKLTTCWREKQ